MSLLKRERAVDIVAASGMVRVSVTPRPAWLAMAFEAVLVVIFAVIFFRFWPSMTTMSRALGVWGLGTAIAAWLYQLSGSETIEFDAQKLVITKQLFGWSRTREQPITDCRNLEWHELRSEGDSAALQCKVGWRTVRFAKYISEDEATEVITTLQANLPEVAHKLLAIPPSHFTTLKLN